MRIGLALVAALALAAAVPPAWFLGAEFLVFLGLGAFYAVTRTSRRPLLAAYLMGMGYMLAFSWSLRHVLWAGYVAIGFVGAVYFLVAAAWTRALSRVICGPIAFGCAAAATFWMRAEMPEIPYPHGQPIHDFHRWPAVLGCVALGGEPAGNFLLAALSAACVDLWGSWRVAMPSWRAAWTTLSAVLSTGLVLTVAASSSFALSESKQEGGDGQEHALDVAVLEPGFAALFQHKTSAAEAVLERLIRPTEVVAGPGVSRPPALVVWPESCYRARARESGASVFLDPAPLRIDLAPETSLLAGAEMQRADGRMSAVALLLDSAGVVQGWHEKTKVVPAGERIPFLTSLPVRWRDALLTWVEATMGQVPDLEPGRVRAPLSVPVRAPDQPSRRVRIGPLICFENAFPSVVRAHVQAGAQLLVVLSNEAWYRGGAELDQLEAMTVMRCIESRTPAIRCTVDGHTVAFGPDGRCLGRIESGASLERAKVLRLRIPLGQGRLPPLAWLAELVLWLILASPLLLARHVLGSWARVLLTRPQR